MRLRLIDKSKIAKRIRSENREFNWREIHRENLI